VAILVKYNSSTLNQLCGKEACAAITPHKQKESIDPRMMAQHESAHLCTGLDVVPCERVNTHQSSNS